MGLPMECKRLSRRLGFFGALCAAALIDTGGEMNDQFDSVQALQNYLDAFFARRSDLKKTFSLVLITQAHIDHTRGLPMVLSHYIVDTYVDNGAETGSGGRQQKAAHAKAQDSSSHVSWQAVTEPEVNEKGASLSISALRYLVRTTRFNFMPCGETCRPAEGGRAQY